jgi:hypothetical protein
MLSIFFAHCCLGTTHLPNKRYIEALATESDQALDKAYGYGLSKPGANFGWLANMSSARSAYNTIMKGTRDIEVISDAIHEGWNRIAIADYNNELALDSPTPEKKKEQRLALAQKRYADLPEAEKEKDRVVARAILAKMMRDNII